MLTGMVVIFILIGLLMTMTTTPTAPGMAAPSGASPAAPSTPPAGSGQPAGDFVQVDRGRLEAYGGDFHKALADANAYRELGDYGALAAELAKTEGWTLDQARDALNRHAAGGGAYAPAPIPQPVAPSLTEAQVQAILERTFEEKLLPMVSRQFGSALDGRDERIRTQARRESERQMAFKREEDFIIKSLEGMKFKLFEDSKAGEPRKLTDQGDVLYRDFQHRLSTVQQQQMPAELGAENPHPRGSAEAETWKAENEQARSDYFYNPSQEHLEAAAEAMKWWRDYEFRAAARVAARQEQIPGETLGAGPDGTETKPDFAKLTDQEQADEVMADIPLE